MKRRCLVILAVAMLPGGWPRLVHAADVKLLKATSFPLVISAPGSYRLKRNIDMTASSQPNLQNLNAIEITTDNVTLDLNGYTVLGPCPSQPCAGTGMGITASGDNVTIVNGSVQGMPENGISLNTGTVERVNARRNGRGIEVNSGRVHSCTADGNQTFGIALYAGLLTGNYVTGNGDAGIEAAGGEAVVVSGNVVTYNQSYGIDISRGVITGNATDNNLYNIVAGSAIVAGNTATNATFRGIDVIGTGMAQGNLIHQNGDAGIKLGEGLMTQNAIVGNGSVGAQMSGSPTKTAYSVNVITDNGGGDVSGGTQMGSNLCGVDLSCP